MPQNLLFHELVIHSVSKSSENCVIKSKKATEFRCHNTANITKNFKDITYPVTFRYDLNIFLVHFLLLLEALRLQICFVKRFL
jgi:hypothetical protein